MDTMWREITRAGRALRRTPGFTACAVLMLALAIGAATAVFSVVNAALLRPFPHIDLDRWARLYEQPTNEGMGGGFLAVSIPNYRDWKRESRSFATMALWMPWSFNLSGDDADAERVEALVVTPDLFQTLGLTPAAGRLLQAGDETGPWNPDRPVRISYGLWQRRFGGDPAIAGKKITLNLVPHTVVGVAPRDFAFPPNQRVDVWTPQSARGMASDQNRSARGLQVSALLRPGVTWDAARAEMTVIAARLASEYRDNAGFGVAIVPMRDSLTGPFRTPLLVMLGALGLVIVLVCVNIANLMLVRLEARRRELAVRAALGATRARLIRETLMESLLIAIAAGGLGFALAPLCVQLLLAFVPSQQIPWLSVPTDATVLLVTAGIVCTVTAIAGVLPARAQRADRCRVRARQRRPRRHRRLDEPSPAARLRRRAARAVVRAGRRRRAARAKLHSIAARRSRVQRRAPAHAVVHGPARAIRRRAQARRPRRAHPRRRQPHARRGRRRRRAGDPVHREPVVVPGTHPHRSEVRAESRRTPARALQRHHGRLRGSARHPDQDGPHARRIISSAAARTKWACGSRWVRGRRRSFAS